MNKLNCIICFLLCLSCTQVERWNNSYTVKDTRKPRYSATEINTKLNAAYTLYLEKQEIDTLESIFSEWNQNISANSQQFINQNDTIKNIYSIFEEIYRPFDFSRLGDWEVGNDFNKGSIYTTIQNSIYYSVILSDTFDNFYALKAKEDSISDFRPTVALERTKILYLVPEYKAALDSFLGSGNIINKSNVVRKFIPLFHAHTESHWHLETSPKVETIILNKSLNRAVVKFQIRFQGGEARLQKSGSGWKIIDSKSTWIQ